MFKVKITNYDGTTALYSFYNKSDVRSYLWNNGCRLKAWTVYRKGIDISKLFL